MYKRLFFMVGIAFITIGLLNLPSFGGSLGHNGSSDASSASPGPIVLKPVKFRYASFQ
jgi:hypothetical protein